MSAKKDINYLEAGDSWGVKVGWVDKVVRVSKPGPTKGCKLFGGGKLLGS